jgi:hypothetical protein
MIQEIIGIMGKTQGVSDNNKPKPKKQRIIQEKLLFPNNWTILEDSVLFPSSAFGEGGPR